jgi:catechol 2,3-dioxygenase-like lactoylglutathione lyase family enzyme
VAGFDRSAEDLGNVLALEHVNVTVPDLELAALFYVSGLGFTRDPYIDFGQRNMWVNVGAQQFHLPRAEPQVFRGRIHVAVPDLAALERRLERLAKPLAGTRFEHCRDGDAVAVTCPWGNRLRIHGPGAFPGVELGMPLLEVDVAEGCAAGIARFYRQVMACPVAEAPGATRVRVGTDQTLAFVETGAALPGYDGHHVAVYVARFSEPHRWLDQRGLVTEESNQHQYRFQAIVDPESGETLTELEHEVRSLTHPLYRRPLVNRNPDVGLGNYRPGREMFVPS